MLKSVYFKNEDNKVISNRNSLLKVFIKMDIVVYLLYALISLQYICEKRYWKKN